MHLRRGEQFCDLLGSGWLGGDVQGFCLSKSSAAFDVLAPAVEHRAGDGSNCPFLRRTKASHNPAICMANTLQQFDIVKP